MLHSGHDSEPIPSPSRLSELRAREGSSAIKRSLDELLAALPAVNEALMTRTHSPATDHNRHELRVENSLLLLRRLRSCIEVLSDPPVDKSFSFSEITYLAAFSLQAELVQNLDEWRPDTNNESRAENTLAVAGADICDAYDFATLALELPRQRTGDTPTLGGVALGLDNPTTPV